MKMLGNNLKRKRESRGKSLREIAALAEISASLLSQIENGKATPSLGTLKKLADILNTTVGELMGEKPVNHDIPVMRQKSRKVFRNQGIETQLLTNPDSLKQMEPFCFILEPGACSGDDYYQHFGQEFVIVIQGNLELVLNEKSYFLAKGDSIYFNSSIPHKFRNPGDGKAELIWVVTPPTF
ncbi:MAG: helix-turn-helix transcriptional regulator [Spirochaetales bacterium]|nr:helix-turn-helix transcriptional regulator [Spirochaetales bacterium]